MTSNKPFASPSLIFPYLSYCIGQSLQYEVEYWLEWYLTSPGQSFLICEWKFSMDPFYRMVRQLKWSEAFTILSMSLSYLKCPAASQAAAVTHARGLNGRKWRTPLWTQEVSSCSVWPGPTACILPASGDWIFPKQVPVQTPRPSPGLRQLHRGRLYPPPPHLASQGTALPARASCWDPTGPAQQVQKLKKRKEKLAKYILFSPVSPNF